MSSLLISRRHGKPKTWLITGLLGALAVAYLVLGFMPAQRRIRELRGQVEERRQQIVQFQSMVRAVQHARQRLSQAEEICQRWRSQSPRPTQIAAQLAQITHVAEAAAVAIDRLDPQPTVELNLLAQQHVTLQFHGPFPAVFDWLQRLETLPGTLWIRDLKLHVPAEHDTTPRGELTLTIFVDRSDYANSSVASGR
jgi:Tfp pilus assembly protein PilO